MAVRRSQNFLNQQRVDVPHLRSIESGIRSDFDELLQGLITGLDKSYIINGFEINLTGAIGSSATGLQVLVAESALLHCNSDQAGTFFVVPTGTPNETLSSTTNVRVDGSFTPGAANYVGIELTRQVDDTTTAQVYFWNPTTDNEFTKTVPLAETFDYKFVITSSIWASNVLPLSIVTTDAANNVLDVTDNRDMYNRLGKGGATTPDPSYEYPWSHHSEGRAENPSTSSSSASSPFRGGDKMLKSEKEWKDAVMSMIKEVKGTAFWYSPNSGGSIVKLRSDLANLMMTGVGNISHSAGVAGRINWSDDIFFSFVGSRLAYKLTANPATTHITLSDNQVAYIRLVRDQVITPNLIFTNGGSIVTSVGAVSWTNDVLAGDFIKLGSANDTKYYKILSVDSASQVTLVDAYAEASTGAGGDQAVYAWGTYETNAAPSTDRHIKIADREDVPFDEDTYWLLLRQDNGGAVARVYVRGGGMGALEQGESEEISDETSQQLLEYIGSPSEAISTPDYSGAVAPAVYEQFTVTNVPASDITSGQAWSAWNSDNSEQHYFWYNKDGAGGDPLIGGAFGHEIIVTTGDTDTVIAAAQNLVINTTGFFNSVDNLDGTNTVTLSTPGNATDAANIDVGGAFAIVIDQQGSGALNQYVIDAENLTKSIKRLDMALAAVAASLTQEGYEEGLTVVAGAPADDNEVTGPLAPSSIITIPLNSRNSDVQQIYTVGAGILAVYLNGVRLFVGSDYNEVGAVDTNSTEIETLITLEVDDLLLFKIEGSDASGGGGGGSYTGINLGVASDADVFKQLAGTQFQFRRLTAGPNISLVQNANDIVISSSAGVGLSSGQIYATNYIMTLSDDIGLANTNAADVTFTLPDATLAEGKIFYFKKVDAANTMYIKSITGQLLDGVDIDAAPLAVTVLYESLTIIAIGGAYWII